MEIKKLKKMKLLTKKTKQQESYENANTCCICKEKFERKHVKDMKYLKVSDHYHYTSEDRGAAYSICNLEYSAPKEIPLVFHNGSNYDYHFIIKKLEEEYEGQFSCLGKNT